MGYLYGVYNSVSPAVLLKHGTLAALTRWVHHRPGQCWQIELWKIKR